MIMLSEGEDDWSFISYTLSCIMHQLHDVLGFCFCGPSCDVPYYHARHSLWIPTDSLHIPWASGSQEAFKIQVIPWSRHVGFSHPFQAFLQTHGWLMESHGDFTSPQPLIQNKIGNVSFFQNIRRKDQKRRKLLRNRKMKEMSNTNWIMFALHSDD